MTRSCCEAVCVEPDPRNVARLRQRFSRSVGVTVQQAALSDSSGVGSFAPDETPNSGAGYLAHESSPQAIQVRMTTIDDIWALASQREIDVVKCDIEGEEVNTLRGAERALRAKSIGAFQIEYNSTWLRAGRRLKDAFDVARCYDYVSLAASPMGFTHYPRVRRGT